MCQALIDLRLNKKQIENIVVQLKKLIDQLERAEAPVTDAARRFGVEPRELKKPLREFEAADGRAAAACWRGSSRAVATELESLLDR
jgi:hypothetical protein